MTTPPGGALSESAAESAAASAPPAAPPALPAAAAPAPPAEVPSPAAPPGAPSTTNSASGAFDRPRIDPSVLQGYTFQSGVQCPICEITPQYPSGRSGLHWHAHWRSVGVREYVTIGGLVAGALALQFVGTPPDRARWDGPILFDNPVRDLLRIDSPSGRKTAASVSDALFIWEVLHPTVIDPVLVAWWARESPYVAWQMMVIDAQAYALTFLLTESIKRVTARARPWVATDDCATNPSGSTCGSGGSYLSFYSGHAATTATGAGLICAHHTQLKLYQNAWLDTGTCALAVAGTAMTGAMRIASDNHWVSDVLIGHLVGYASGYLLPTLLYYKEFRLTPHDHPADKPVFAALPIVSAGSLGLSVFGLF